MTAGTADTPGRRRSRHSWPFSATARLLHGLTALVTGTGIATSVYLGWTEGSTLPSGVGYAGGFTAGWEHLLNQPAYFTVLSGILVTLTSSALAVNPDRHSTVFHAVRTAAVVQMVITGIVFNVLLREDSALTGVWWVNDTLLHVIAPVLVPLVWLLTGPYGRLSPRAALASAAIPVTWLAVTLLRGPWLDWYPYVILDVPAMGYSGISVYVVSILGIYVLLAAVLWVTDTLLARLTSS